MGLPVHHCNKCWVPLNSTNTPIRSDNVRGPNPDDFTVCTYCGTWYRFNKDLSLRLISEAEYASIPQRDKERLEQITQQILDHAEKNAALLDRLRWVIVRPPSGSMAALFTY